MVEHWKSTPRYWCKHCTTYVRDTRLERTNHEATARHQSAVKRSLRLLHRSNETEARERERAKREIARLDGVVVAAGAAGAAVRGGSSGRGGTRYGSAGVEPAGGRSGEEERKRQAEELALLGVAVPETIRGELAMAGEWTVTSTTVVPNLPSDSDGVRTEAKAYGVHKRARTEEEKEHEEAVTGLFKKPRRWARDSKKVDGEGGSYGDLDALLRGGFDLKDEERPMKEDEDAAKADVPAVKKEDSNEERSTPPTKDRSLVKTEDGAESLLPADTTLKLAVAFKKRKPRNIRQK